MSYERTSKREAELQAEVDGWLTAAETADTAEDKAFGADRRGDEMPDLLNARLKNPMIGTACCGTRPDPPG